jgi:hypothetical protein
MPPISAINTKAEKIPAPLILVNRCASGNYFAQVFNNRQKGSPQSIMIKYAVA